MKILLSLLLTFMVVISTFAFDIREDTNYEMTIPVPLMYLRASGSSAVILNTTATSGSFTRLLDRASSSLSTSNPTGTITHRADGIYKIALSSTDLATPGSYTLTLTYANCAPITFTFDVLAADAWDAQAGAATSIPSRLTTIAGYIDTEIADILTDTGTTLDTKLNNLATNLAYHAGKANADIVAVTTTQASHTSLINSASAELSARIADSSSTGIPATGGTPPAISLPHIGDATYELTLVSSSYSINEPTISVSVVRSSDGTRLFTKSNFTHVVYDDFDIPGVYTHYWKLPISGENLTYGIYIVSGSIDREGTPQPFGGLLNHQGNLEISDTPAAVAFYAAAGEMLEDIMLSRDYSYRAWRSLDVLNRATPGVSSEASIYCPSGAVFGTELRYISPINGLVRKASIMDYDEVMGNNPSNGRWTAIPVDSVTAAAVILGVTLTPSF